MEFETVMWGKEKIEPLPFPSSQKGSSHQFNTVQDRPVYGKS